MTLRVEIDGKHCLLHLEGSGRALGYRLEGSVDRSGSADLAEIAPGVYSVLLGRRQICVYLDVALDKAGQFEMQAGAEHHSLSVSDARDRPGGARRGGESGPAEIRAQMPGKVIRVLVERGQQVEAGQGLMVVEAMKMQNEMKSSRAGTVSEVYVAEGATVTAGERLLALE